MKKINRGRSDRKYNRESRRSKGQFDVKSDENVTVMLINEIQKKCCWSKKMADMKQSHHLQLRKFKRSQEFFTMCLASSGWLHE